MKLNKNCPQVDYCKSENAKLDSIWRYGCPKWVGAKKTAEFDQCMRYEEAARYVREHGRAPGKCEEQV